MIKKGAIMDKRDDERIEGYFEDSGIGTLAWYKGNRAMALAFARMATDNKIKKWYFRCAEHARRKIELIESGTLQ